MGTILQILCKFLGINSDEELGTKVLNVKTSLNLEYILLINAKVQNISNLQQKTPTKLGFYYDGKKFVNQLLFNY